MAFLIHLLVVIVQVFDSYLQIVEIVVAALVKLFVVGVVVGSNLDLNV
jgi:hypothetical protein